MPLLTAHEATHARPAPPARCFSLVLSAWAEPTARGSALGSRVARKPGLARQVLQHMRSHPTGTER
jgi:hypothetical protein